MRKLVLCSLLILLFYPSVSQQANVWYFGGEAGLNFNTPSTNVPAVMTDGKMQAAEACGTICDADGKLLFYTNGVTVYNRLHETMLNGTGLMGHVSAMQSAIIVQVPDKNIYYIFTADAFETNFANGYRYSIVDMSRDNGYGEVTSKNNLLWLQCSERITAARHANGSDVWVITNDRNSNIFRSWLVDCNGLQTTPVVSTTGAILDFHTLANVGILKVSPDGGQLCQTHYPDPNDIPGSPNDFYQLFDFNNATGVISNPVIVNSIDVTYFGCEYSPSSQLLYLCATNNNLIDQVEPRLPTAAGIQASRVRISTDPAAVTALQLGPNGKIYLARPGAYIDVINSPDTKGPGCDYRFEHIFLNGKTSQLQLPGMINDIPYDPHNQFTFQILDSCSGNVQFNGHTVLPGTIQWQWDFGDGNTSTLQNPVHQFNPTGRTYTVTLSISSSFTCTRKFKIVKQIAPSGQVSVATFEFKPICDSGYVRFINTSDPLMATNGYFVWDFGDGNTSTETNPVHTYALPGNYTVRLSYTTALACLNDVATQSIDLQVYPVSTIPDQTIFVSEAVQLLVNAQQGVAFQWSPPLWLSDPGTRSPIAVPLDDIVYTVSVTNQNGCVGKDSVFIRVLPLDDIYIPTGFTPNGDGKNETIYPLFGTHFTLKEFSVFNRWGQRVFSTQMRGYGWNGKINGKLQGTGVFVYIVRLVDSTGKLYDKKGTFTLIR